MLNEKIINLSTLNDWQKSLLARISYLDIDTNIFQKLKLENKDIKISDLHNLLKTPDNFYVGAVADIGVIKKVAGMEMTDRQLLETIESAGLGNLKVKDVRSNTKSGFEGMCFSDYYGNVGLSFRGTDLKTFKSLLNDVGTDVISYLTVGKVAQVKDAKEMFEDNFDKVNRNNYLYGHSLGGHLVENIFADSHDYIKNAFVINPFNLDESVIENNPDKVKAFNNSEKFDCVIVGGDVVSKINPPTCFVENIRYVANSERRKNNFLYAHTVEAGKIDETGKFEETSKEKAYENYDMRLIDKFMGFADNVKKESRIKLGLIKNVLKGFSSIKNKLKGSVSSLKDFIKNHRKKQEKQELLLPAKSDKTRNEFDQSLKLENYINDTNFTEKDYKEACKFFANGVKCINNDNSNNKLDKKTYEEIELE